MSEAHGQSKAFSFQLCAIGALDASSSAVILLESISTLVNLCNEFAVFRIRSCESGVGGRQADDDVEESCNRIDFQNISNIVPDARTRPALLTTEIDGNDEAYDGEDNEF